MIDVLGRLLRPLRTGVVTSDYPDQPPLLAPAARGLPRVDPARCTFDRACVAACPTSAITVAEEAGGRARWSVDAGRCVYCAECERACPTGAIRLTGPVELAARSRPDASAEGRVLADAIRRRLARSLHVRHLDAGSCNGCDFEIAALLNPYHDLQRFGVDFVASPRHADLLLVTGTLTRNLEEAALRTYEAMPEPRLVVAAGACAIGGGVFAGTYASRDGIGEVLPVDVRIPGCPPRPEALIHGLLLAVGRMPGGPIVRER